MDADLVFLLCLPERKKMLTPICAFGIMEKG